jgi:hypothetical protein
LLDSSDLISICSTKADKLTMDDKLPHPPSLTSTKSEDASIASNGDASWKQLQQIASVDNDAMLRSIQESKSDEMSLKAEMGKGTDKEIVMPTPTNASVKKEGQDESPEGQPGIKESISRTSSLSASPETEEISSVHHHHHPAGPPPSVYHDRHVYHYPHHPHHPMMHYRGPPPPNHPYSRYPHPSTLPGPSRLHYTHVPPHHPMMYDENSPSASTISTKDTRSFFPPASQFAGATVMKPKLPVHLKTSREEESLGGEGKDGGDAKRRKLNEEVGSDIPKEAKIKQEETENDHTSPTNASKKEEKECDDISPTNASSAVASDAPSTGFDVGDLGQMPSWDCTIGKPLAGLSVCSGMTGMESLINRDAGFSAFSFSSEVGDSKKDTIAGKEKGVPGAEEDFSPDNKSILSRGKRKGVPGQGHHVQFSRDSYYGMEHPPMRKRLHVGMPPPPARYGRHYHSEDYYMEGQSPYEYSPPLPGRYHPRHYPRDAYLEEEYYDYHYGPHPPRESRYGRMPPPPRDHYFRGCPPPPHQGEAGTSRGAPGSRLPSYSVHDPKHPIPPTVHDVNLPPALRMPIAGGWSKDDDAELIEIMKKNKNVKNWEPIATKLDRGKRLVNIGCNGCCVMSLHPLLISLSFMPSNSAQECQDRWTRFLKPGSRKGQWTDAEDRFVMDAVTNSIEEPFTRWSDLAQQLPGRVGKQVRDRWVNHLNPAINHLPFNKEDVSPVIPLLCN